MILVPKIQKSVKEKVKEDLEKQLSQKKPQRVAESTFSSSKQGYFFAHLICDWLFFTEKKV